MYLCISCINTVSMFFRYCRSSDSRDASSFGGGVRQTASRHPRLRLRPHGERGQTGQPFKTFKICIYQTPSHIKKVQLLKYFFGVTCNFYLSNIPNGFWDLITVSQWYHLNKKLLGGRLLQCKQSLENW